GRGSIPLEAQRLGLKCCGSDLNPIAVLITKALVEIPPKFIGRPPVNPKAKSTEHLVSTWRGVRGLAEDITYYAEWVRSSAEMRIGHLFPPMQVLGKSENRSATVVTWLWARTVKCPN